MIMIPTVLVLGAGASYPYGFPTAKELKNLICDAFSNANTPASCLLGDNSDYSREDFFGFREAFLKSGQPSVDAFLERRPNFFEIGKLAIAYCLIPFEDESKLFRPPRHDSGDWYEYLSVKLNASFDDFGSNKLSIVTFNYDRSVEHYLHTSLQNLHGRSRDDCNTTLGKIPIIHVYGQLGKMPYSVSGAFSYGPRPELKYEDVAAAAEGITLLHEEASDLNEAHRLLAAASRICFLGFSYHELNVKRLKTSAVGSKQIFGTCRGLIGGERHDVETRIHEAFGSRLKFGGDDNLETLRCYQILGG
jgi:hypothetical protein